LQNIFYTFQTKGIFDIKALENTFLPLFNGKDININITLKEYYEITKIELHYFATNINSFECVDISYKTHPDWKLIHAIYTSCSLPILFSPLVENEKCYSDGGFFANYPIEYCINNGAKANEILGISRCSMRKLNLSITEDSSLIDYIFNIFYKVTEFILNGNSKKTEIKYEIIVESPPMSLYDIYLTTSSMETRINLIKKGIDAWNSIYSKISA
jgi:predicted acylesterase/phospholipase RssA